MKAELLAKMPRQYALEIFKFRKRIDVWRRGHHNIDVKIQFNLPPCAGAIYPIEQAINEHILSANEAGLEMLKATAYWGRRDEMTVNMLSIALEL